VHGARLLRIVLGIDARLAGLCVLLHCNDNYYVFLGYTDIIHNGEIANSDDRMAHVEVPGRLSLSRLHPNPRPRLLYIAPMRGLNRNMADRMDLCDVLTGIWISAAFRSWQYKADQNGHTETACPGQCCVRIIDLIAVFDQIRPQTYLVGGSWGIAAPSERGSPAAKFTWRLLSRTTAAPCPTVKENG